MVWLQKPHRYRARVGAAVVSTGWLVASFTSRIRGKSARGKGVGGNWGRGDALTCGTGRRGERRQRPPDGFRVRASKNRNCGH
jgi:hypothetical protein